MLGILENDDAIAALYIMLTYLRHLGLYRTEEPIVSTLFSRQRKIGAIDLRLIHGILDRHLVGGAPFPRWFSSWQALIVLKTLFGNDRSATKLGKVLWNMLFPPSLPDRYHLKFHVDRIARLLGVRRSPPTRD
jgi:hypothetical protein